MKLIINNQNYYLGGIRILSAWDYIEVYGMVNAGSGNAVINQQSTLNINNIMEQE